MPGRKAAPTRKDVARMADVSETIVSYVLNNNRYVSAEKRRRVLEAVEALRYRPNSIARALKGKGNSHILFIVDNVANEYFGRLIQEIDAVAYDSGYLVSLMGAKNDEEFVSRILARQVDAVIISSATLAERFVQELIDAGLPVVLLMTRDYAAIRGRAARIYTGIESGIMAAVRLLHETGCRHIVHVDRVSRSGHFSTRQDLRFRGFCNQMEALGLPLDEHAILSHCESYEALFDAICARLRNGPPADGFVCRNDRLALTVLSAALACGRDVPGEVSIVGFDNTDAGMLMRPALSSVSHDQAGIARAALELIERMVRGEAPPERHFVTRLLPRDTTRRP